MMQPQQPQGSADEEWRRQEWIDYYVEVGDLDAAEKLGWDGERRAGDGANAGPGAAGRRAHEPAHLAAATTVQARYRAHAQRAKYKDARNEAARLQWIEFYVATKEYDKAREYGWDGKTPPTRTVSAAVVVQSHYRGFRQRDDFKDIHDEASRKAWADHYTRTGQASKAAELAQQPSSDAPGGAEAQLAPAPRPAPSGAPPGGPRTLGQRGTLCLRALADSFTSAASKEARLAKLRAVLQLQRHVRGLLVRQRERLRQREALLDQLVSKQEARHAKRVDYYVATFLRNLERGAAVHKGANTIQAGFRGHRARAARRALAAERAAREREAAAALKAAADASDEQRKEAARQQLLADLRPMDVRPGMTVARLNAELERRATEAARAEVADGRGRELQTRAMRGARGQLKKTSPMAFAPRTSAHVRFFYFEDERLCWRKGEEDEAGKQPVKSLPISSFTSVEVLEPLDKREFCLQAGFADRPYVFSAPTMRQLVVWVQALKVILALREQAAAVGGARARGGD